MVYMIESQIAYVMDALRSMRSRGADIVEVKPEVERAYNQELQRRMQGTVWNTGCTSWYQDAKGNNPTLWPAWTLRFRRRTARLDPAEYDYTIGSHISSATTATINTTVTTAAAR